MESEQMETGKANMDNLLQNDDASKQKKTRLIIIIASILIVCAIIIIIVVASSNKSEQKDDKVPDPDYKFTSIETVTLPEGIIYDGHAIYSKTGRIILQYKMENDNTNLYFGVMDEDGSNLKKIWGGEWKNYYDAKNNRIRLMPFDDNKKILTGDYVLECSPNIDDCQQSQLLPVIYPLK